MLCNVCYTEFIVSLKINEHPNKIDTVTFETFSKSFMTFRKHVLN